MPRLHGSGFQTQSEPQACAVPNPENPAATVSVERSAVLPLHGALDAADGMIFAVDLDLLRSPGRPQRLALSAALPLDQQC